MSVMIDIMLAGKRGSIPTLNKGLYNTSLHLCLVKCMLSICRAASPFMAQMMENFN